MKSKRVYDFICNKWLSGQDGDRKTYRDIQMSNDRAFIESKYYIGCSIILMVGLVWFMVFNATFNNISVILWRSVLLVVETGENY
jgi:hypothetical protein